MSINFNISNWFEEYYAGLFRFILKLTGDYHESEDIIQDTYLRAILKFPLYNSDRGSVKNWLYKIAVNIFYDRERFKRREENVAKEYYRENEDINDDGNLSIDVQYSKEIIERAVNMLAADKRAMFILSLKTSVRDMAEIFSIAEGTVKSRMYYIRKELCANLKKIYKEENL